MCCVHSGTRAVCACACVGVSAWVWVLLIPHFGILPVARCYRPTLPIWRRPSANTRAFHAVSVLLPCVRRQNRGYRKLNNWTTHFELTFCIKQNQHFFIHFIFVHKIVCLEIFGQNITKSLDSFSTTRAHSNIHIFPNQNFHSFKIFPLLPTVKQIVGSQLLDIRSSVLY